VGAISIENQHCFCVSKCVIGTIGEGWQWSRAEWRGKIASTGITNGHHMVSGRSRSNPESLVKLHPNLMWLAVSRCVAYGTYTLGQCSCRGGWHKLRHFRTRQSRRRTLPSREICWSKRSNNCEIAPTHPPPYRAKFVEGVLQGFDP
jgi:hypothetical protein